MNEKEALLPFRGRRSYSIPRTLQYWLYFKRHILEKENVRKTFQDLSLHLDKSTYRDYLFNLPDATPQCYGPRFCRVKNRSTRERSLRELISITYRYYEALLSPLSPIEVRQSTLPTGGLGIFLKKTTTLKLKHDQLLLPKVFWGLALEINEDDYETLVDSNYPSLLCGYRKKRYIIAGPIALVNHACKSSLCFTLPRRLIEPEILPEEFQDIPSVRALARRDVELLAGSELFVDYFSKYSVGDSTVNVFGEDCRCPCCSRVK